MAVGRINATLAERRYNVVRKIGVSPVLADGHLARRWSQAGSLFAV